MTEQEDRVKNLFNVLNDSSDLLVKALDTNYLGALIETGENLIHREVHQEDDQPDQATVDQLRALYQSINLADYEPNEIRQALQVAILKGLNAEKVDVNLQMTPDVVGYTMAFLIDLLVPNSNQSIEMFDPTVGTGNLLSTVMDQLNTNRKQTTKAYGIDNNEDLLALASMSTQLQRLDVNLIHQDVVDKLLIPKIDLTLADLPVGYYPVDERANEFELKADSGHSFSHYLILEQTINQLNENGWGFFLVPNNVFQTESSKNLVAWILKNAYLQGLLALPKSLFKDELSQKAILIIQKHGDTAKQAKQVLLGEFPDAEKNREESIQFIQSIRDWKRENLI